MLFQRTLARETKVGGRGIHSGKKVELTLIPANSDTGIVFVRTDLPERKEIPAHALRVSATENNTGIGEKNYVIHTIEHLLSALYALGIDNLLIEINGPEVPIMDGSAAPFIYVLKEAGLTHLSQHKKFLVVKKELEVKLQDKWAVISPCDHLIIESEVVFPHPLIKRQKMSFQFSPTNYIREISRARTFGFFKDVDMLKRKGLARGGSLDNAIVLDDFKVMNSEGLRFPNEFIRHKILDVVGDMSLLGHPLLGRMKTFRSGHLVHNQLCRKILSDPSNYEIISAISLPKTVEEDLTMLDLHPSLA
ncbi:MAG: UDP-3-O-acyl-N-acetylglucosamine deacetylase [Bacteriovoracaceae bacterium]|nr:UDP-3-O-acyl-N-acetylglucosamine deacetylase [Bacteriovoracaceae bacterium]